MALTLVEKPAVEPITLAEIKAHLRLDTAEEDDYLESLIRSGRQWLENYLDQSLISQHWQLLWHTNNDFQALIPLPKGPVMTIQSVKSNPGIQGRAMLCQHELEVRSNHYSVRVFSPAKNFEVNYIAGYGEIPGEIPEDLRHCLRRLVGVLYEQRRLVDFEQLEDVILMLQPYKKMRVI